MTTIREEARDIPVVAECDVCVIGGSCTGVFAAVRAARLGKTVVLIEKTNAFGGVATNGLVCIWHSLHDTVGRQQIIGGLTLEIEDRLRKRGAATEALEKSDHGVRFNPEELKIELDQLVLEHNITPMLHTSFCAPVVEEGEVKAITIENKDGRSAIKAGVYIDASGDGDLFARAGVPFSVDEQLQSPTTCALIKDLWRYGFDFRKLYNERHKEFGLEPDAGWQCMVPGLPSMHMCAQMHVFGANCSDATQLTTAEMEGRRQIRAVMDMIRKYGPQGEDIALANLASHIGIRETRRFEAEYRLTEDDVLWGKPFADAIAQGSYRVDVHYAEGGGFMFKYLDGTTQDMKGGGCHAGRWRDPVEEDPTYYQIPYRTMVHKGLKNAIMAGRMIGTDSGAFGAVRVMVNLNQVGEAAGTAASVSLDGRCSVLDVDVPEVRKLLNDGGSCLI